MTRPNYKYFRKSYLEHSAKGTTWETHKYIKRLNGTYYYPDSYKGGRHLPTGEGTEESDESFDLGDLSSEDIEALAREVILGNFGNGQVRKDLLGDAYAAVQRRVNEILKGSAGSKSVSEASTESVTKAEDAAKNASTTKTNSNVVSGVDMNKVLEVYNKQRNRR